MFWIWLSHTLKWFWTFKISLLFFSSYIENLQCCLDRAGCSLFNLWQWKQKWQWIRITLRCVFFVIWIKLQNHFTQIRDIYLLAFLWLFSNEPFLALTLSMSLRTLNIWMSFVGWFFIRRERWVSVKGIADDPFSFCIVCIANVWQHKSSGRCLWLRKVTPSSIIRYRMT